ncbi:MAG TPA: hypothetical protein VFX33_00330 [Actinomycetales bacterium]|nr:hypothetical protein [Actinomycetales bacterium]
MRWPWQRRPDQRVDALGEGLWRHTHDRFRRAVDRYHQMLEAVRSEREPHADADTHAALEAAGSELVTALDRVHELCVRAQSLTPTEGLDIPRGWSDFQRALSRAGTMAAQAAEGVALVRVAGRSGDRAQASAAVGTVQRAVRDVVQLIENASAAAEIATGTEWGRTSPGG